MSVTVKFDGAFEKKIRNVNPSDIVLNHRKLYVKGIIIPVALDYLFDAYLYLARNTFHKHGILIVNLLKTGELEFYSKTSDYSPDYYVGLVLGFGSDYPTKDSVRHIATIPAYDEYRSGEEDLFP